MDSSATFLLCCSHYIYPIFCSFIWLPFAIHLTIPSLSFQGVDVLNSHSPDFLLFLWFNSIILCCGLFSSQPFPSPISISYYWHQYRIFYSKQHHILITLNNTYSTHLRWPSTKLKTSWSTDKMVKSGLFLERNLNLCSFPPVIFQFNCNTTFMLFLRAHFPDSLHHSTHLYTFYSLLYKHCKTLTAVQSKYLSPLTFLITYDFIYYSTVLLWLT